MPNRRYNTQVANPMKSGGRVAKMRWWYVN